MEAEDEENVKDAYCLLIVAEVDIIVFSKKHVRLSFHKLGYSFLI